LATGSCVFHYSLPKTTTVGLSSTQTALVGRRYVVLLCERQLWTWDISREVVISQQKQQHQSEPVRQTIEKQHSTLKWSMYPVEGTDLLAVTYIYRSSSDCLLYCVRVYQCLDDTTIHWTLLAEFQNVRFVDRKRWIVTSDHKLLDLRRCQKWSGVDDVVKELGRDLPVTEEQAKAMESHCYLNLTLIVSEPDHRTVTMSLSGTISRWQDGVCLWAEQYNWATTDSSHIHSSDDMSQLLCAGSGDWVLLRSLDGKTETAKASPANPVWDWDWRVVYADEDWIISRANDTLHFSHWSEFDTSSLSRLSKQRQMAGNILAFGNGYLIVHKHKQISILDFRFPSHDELAC
jgi:hypothetical protein